MSYDEAYYHDLFDRMGAAYNGHDAEAFANFFTEDGEWWLARGPETCGQRCVGREEIRAMAQSRFGALRDVRLDVSRLWIKGNLAVAEWLFDGTTAEGEKWRWLGCDLFELRDGLVAKKDTYWKQVTK